jgi:hypothetical protein
MDRHTVHASLTLLITMTAVFLANMATTQVRVEVEEDMYYYEEPSWTRFTVFSFFAVLFALYSFFLIIDGVAQILRAKIGTHRE